MTHVQEFTLRLLALGVGLSLFLVVAFVTYAASTTVGWRRSLPVLIPGTVIAALVLWAAFAH